VVRVIARTVALTAARARLGRVDGHGPLASRAAPPLLLDAKVEEVEALVDVGTARLLR